MSISATKPMLADDYNADKVKYPVVAQPKIDGVRGIHLGRGFTGRSLKSFKNVYITGIFSHPQFSYLDGECAAQSSTHPALCRLTTSAMSTIEGSPFILWHVFDYLAPGVIHLPYSQRLECLSRYVCDLQSAPDGKDNSPARGHLRVIEYKICRDRAELEEYDERNLSLGYEGTIIRDPKGLYKNGRSTIREGGLLRIKHFVEEEALVHAIKEGQTNENEATINALGYTERSSHMENKTPNGMVGAFLCTDLKTGNEIVVSPGKMDHADRRHYFENQHLILGKAIKYKKFLKGEKDKPRFPTFQCIRDESDM